MPTEIENMTVGEFFEMIGMFLVSHFPRIFSTVVFLVFAFVCLYTVMRIIRRILGRSKIDVTLHPFILAVTKMTLLVLIFIVAAGILGVELMPFIAVIGTLGLAFSLAVRDSLSNVAGGIAVLFSRPFHTDDYVEINGQLGTVTELGLMYTKLLTADNKTVYLPNGDVAKATIVNYSDQPIQRLDLNFDISDGSDYTKVREMIFGVIKSAPGALTEPEPTIRMTDQSASAAKMTVMVWVNTPDLPELKNNLIEKIRTRLSVDA